MWNTVRDAYKAVCGVPYIHFLVYILIRDRIVSKIDGDIVVQLNNSRFPLRKLWEAAVETEAPLPGIRNGRNHPFSEKGHR